MVADAGMNGICKVQCRGVAAQVYDLALGCENKYLIREQIRFRTVEELHRIGTVPLHLDQLHQPFPRTYLR